MKYCIFLFIGILVGSCQSSDLFSGYRSELVVEGWLNDLDTFQYIILSQSQSFNDQDEITYISDASVTVISSSGARHSYSYSTEGTYYSNQSFAGVKGESYYVRIVLADGSVVQSEYETMTSAPVIDSIAYEYYETTSEETNEKIKIYYPIIFAQDEANVSNYYRFKLYRNDTAFSSTDYIVLLSDEFFDGNAFENDFTDFVYHPGDTALVELWEISETAYNYLDDLVSQSSNLGSVTSVTPSTINGNLSYTDSDDNVLGFWGVTSIKRRGIIIE